MTTNDIFYKLRKIFSWDEEKIGDLFKSVDYPVPPPTLFAWMKQEQFEGFQIMPEEALAALLNAIIVEKRGLKDGQLPVHEKELNNNSVLRKLKIALSFKDEDIIESLRVSDMRIGKSEVSAFFRDPKHSHYRPCGDQFLRNFLRGLLLQSQSKK
jgi:uncharacterized protein YehS (DUF1456 family)